MTELWLRSPGAHQAKDLRLMIGGKRMMGSDPIMSRSSSTSSSMSIDDASEKVFVAVTPEYKKGISNLSWVLNGELRNSRVVLLYVHVPATLVPLMGGLFPVSELSPQQLQAHRKIERANIKENMGQYLHACRKEKVQAERLVMQSDDIANGILKVIAKHGVTKLVMGAAADKYYSKKMKTPQSKTACSVMKEAPPSCNIWFICKGKLIHIKEATANVLPPTTRTLESPSSRSTVSDNSGSGLSSQGSGLSTEEYRHSLRAAIDRDSLITKLPAQLGIDPYAYSLPQSPLSTAVIEITPDFPKAAAPRSPLSGVGSEESCRANGITSHSDEPRKHTGYRESCGTMSSSYPDPDVAEDDERSSSENEYLYDHLKEALNEVTRFKDEAHEESCRRSKAEMELLEANRKVKVLETKYAQEVKHRKELEELLEAEKSKSEKLRMEIQSLAREKQELQKLKESDAYMELQIISKQKLALEIQIVELERMLAEEGEKLLEEKELNVALMKERDSAVRDLEKLRRRRGTNATGRDGQSSSSFSEFSRAELEQATANFDESLKLGEGGYGSMFRGSLRKTTVAIRVLQVDLVKDKSSFLQEAALISGTRHPNIVQLLGASREASALVYEFLPNGSLEDRLACKNSTPPLPWRVRIQILVDICSALVFLHSSAPAGFIHGDLRPANVLLDASNTGKLADLGIKRLIQQQASINGSYHWTDTKGTFVYLDPEFFSSGQLTDSSDVYSFGVMTLRLLTGKPALGIAREMQDAYENGKVASLLDAAAGEWPLAPAQQLAQLGISCCEMMRKSRPDLSSVSHVLESVMKLVP